MRIRRIQTNVNTLKFKLVNLLLEHNELQLVWKQPHFLVSRTNIREERGNMHVAKHAFLKQEIGSYCNFVKSDCSMTSNHCDSPSVVKCQGS